MEFAKKKSIKSLEYDRGFRNDIDEAIRRSKEDKERVNEAMRRSLEDKKRVNLMRMSKEDQKRVNLMRMSKQDQEKVNEAMRRSLEDLEKVKETNVLDNTNLRNIYPLCIRTFGFSIYGLFKTPQIIVQIDINKITKEKEVITEKNLIEEIIKKGRNKIQSWGNYGDLIDDYNKTFNNIKPWLQSSIENIMSNDTKDGCDYFWLYYHPDGDCQNEHKDYDELPLGNLTKSNETFETLRESINQLSKRFQKLESSNYMSNNSSIYH